MAHKLSLWSSLDGPVGSVSRHRRGQGVVIMATTDDLDPCRSTASQQVAGCFHVSLVQVGLARQWTTTTAFPTVASNDSQ